MLGSGGGAQCGHAIADAELRQRHYVHIAFHHQDAAGFFHGGAGFVEAVEVFAFIEQRGVRRVEVFGFGVVQHAAAEADNLPAAVADGEHDAVAEAVVVAAVFFNHHAAVDQRFGRVGGETLRQRPPAVGRIAQAVVGGDFVGEAAFFQVAFGCFAGGQLAGVEGGGLGGGFFQGLLALFAARARFGAFLPTFLLRHRHAGAVGQILHGFGEAQSLVFHDETDGRAVRAAAEAVVELFARADGERRGLFFVERAAGHVVGAAFLQRHALVDDVDNIGFGQQLVDEFAGNHASALGLGNGLRLPENHGGDF